MSPCKERLCMYTSSGDLVCYSATLESNSKIHKNRKTISLTSASPITSTRWPTFWPLCALVVTRWTIFTIVWIVFREQILFCSSSCIVVRLLFHPSIFAYYSFVWVISFFFYFLAARAMSQWSACSNRLSNMHSLLLFRVKTRSLNPIQRHSDDTSWFNNSSIFYTVLGEFTKNV